ncbi:RNA-binding Raly-like protein [Oncorhynchus tshawytscha]|uniref:RNA-binding Raly-like protein n=1 Tax=Oncorhynchus tshawytscha TaxID=74940 RepID=UPI000D0A4F9D|nr:RNA-binding Raly-like protein [Oncorhynchus tshawytscha]XP_042157090.1 RNA-binding Raly-like protein [Oncorhynchus tshawytscha]
MAGELRPSRPKAGTKRASSEAFGSDYDLEYDSYPDDLYNRVFDYQRVPASMMPAPVEPSPMKHSHGPSSSSGLHRSRDRLQGKRSAQRTGSSSNRAKLKLAELLAIKSELTLIKVQIDGLLDSVEKMDRRRKDHSDSPLTGEGSVSDSVSSLDDSPVSLHHRQRESPEPGEASDDYHQHHHRIHNHHSDLEDNM